MSRINHLGYTRRECPVCGKEYYTDRTVNWSFKFRPIDGGPPVYYCSWPCLRTAEKEKDARRKQKRAWVFDPEEEFSE